MLQPLITSLENFCGYRNRLSLRRIFNTFKRFASLGSNHAFLTTFPNLPDHAIYFSSSTPPRV